MAKKPKLSEIFPQGNGLNQGWARWIFVLLVVLVNVGCDQVSKQVVRDKVVYHEEISLISDQFILTKVENTGAFLSLGSDLSGIWRKVLLLYLPAVAMLVVLGVVLAQKDLTLGVLFGACCMIGGGIGNLIDRWLYGSVTDFLHIDLEIVRTGVFNLADVSIMTGAIVVMVLSFMKGKSKDLETEAPE